MAKDKDDPLFAVSPGGETGSGSEPLASRMRPRSLDEFVGQDHIVGPGRLLRRAIQKDQLGSIILSGPPGTGKTTLARVIANCTSSRFLTLNAVLAGVAEIRTAIEEAKRHRELYDRKTILFVDEVHRWNKSQQDALLPWVENGTVVLVGATTENPFFEVNRALVSRSRVFQLRALGERELLLIARAALADTERGYGRWRLAFEEGALEHLVSVSEGDARSLLNALELAIETSAEPWPPPDGAELAVSLAAAEESIQRRAVLYDKDGDYHYDAASAFIKSLRGSDPDAALYWLARMVYAGEDPSFAFRRMLISACEDIGLADPGALTAVLSCAEAFDRIGMPEGQFHLAQAALYLATAPKSNSALGYFDALKSVEAESAEVPSHLKDSNRDAEGYGHGEGYAYPHAFRDHWVAQQYLPTALRGRIFYQPGALGLEGERRGLVLERREAQLAALFEAEKPAGASVEGESAAEESSWSRSGEKRAAWRSRAESSAPARLAALRRELFDLASPARAARILVPEAKEGYLVWEALRRAREGTVAAMARDGREAELVSQFASTLPEIERPLVAELDVERISPETLEAAFGFSDFDLIAARDLFSRRREPSRLLESLASSVPGALLVCGETLIREGSRLSTVLPERSLGSLGKRFRDFESEFYGRGDIEALGPVKDDLMESMGSRAQAGLQFIERRIVYPRRFGRDEIGAWLSVSSPYGAAAAEAFAPEELSLIASAAEGATRSFPVEWTSFVLFVLSRFPAR